MLQSCLQSSTLSHFWRKLSMLSKCAAGSSICFCLPVSRIRWKCFLKTKLAAYPTRASMARKSFKTFAPGCCKLEKYFQIQRSGVNCIKLFFFVAHASNILSQVFAPSKFHFIRHSKLSKAFRVKRFNVQSLLGRIYNYYTWHKRLAS